MATINYPGTPRTVLYGGMATPAVGSVITTLSLVNTSGSEQAAGFVSPMFGLPIKQGDIPAGEYPQFTLTDDTPCPATIWGVTSWPDGSMKFCGAMIRVPAAVAGSGSVTINVRSGGSAPAASARAVSDLTAADIKAELTGVTNLSGAWTASLNTAITDADDIVLIGNGPAGAIWRIGGPFKQGGAAHGQLHCWHYVAALQNSANGLAGVRYLGRVAQPWADVTSPTPTRRVFTAALKSGAATLRTLQGHDTTETPGANIGIGHYTSFFTAGADGRWDFVQGGGSASADCTVSVQHDQTHVIKSRLVLPYDTSVVVTDAPSVDYAPYCKGSFVNRAMGGTGERSEIGVLPTWVAKHVLKPNAVHERAVRVSAMATAGWRVGLRKSSTKQVIPCIATQASYTGLGTVDESVRYFPANSSANSGVNLPAVDSSLWSGEETLDHRGSAAYYAYIMSGEPQYLDLLIEQAAEAIVNRATGVHVRRTTTPLTSFVSSGQADSRDVQIGSGGTIYKGGGIMFDLYGKRNGAWALRDIVHAAAICPDADPAGTAVKDYFRDVADNAMQAVLAYVQAMPTSYQDAGFFFVRENAADIYSTEQPWQDSYMTNATAHAASITGLASASSLCAYFAKRYTSQLPLGDFSAISSYTAKHWDENGNVLLDPSKLTFRIELSAISFNATTDRATVTSGGWLPTNGDLFLFDSYHDPFKPFAAAVNGKVFYAVNCSSNTFQLSATQGGSAIDVTATGTCNLFFCRLANSSPLLSYEGTQNADGYMAITYSALRHLEAIGVSAVASARAAQDAKLAASTLSFSNDPKNALTASYPG